MIWGCYANKNKPLRRERLIWLKVACYFFLVFSAISLVLRQIMTNMIDAS